MFLIDELPIISSHRFIVNAKMSHSTTNPSTPLIDMIMAYSARMIGDISATLVPTIIQVRPHSAPMD
jgi:hypothetical protein